jgi:hypothetical protein
VLEDPTTPTFLSLSAIEWHAFGFGLKEGLWFWKRTPLAWDEIKKMEQLPETEKPLSPELIEALLQKYHYYIIGFALPEDCTLFRLRGVSRHDECTGACQNWAVVLWRFRLKGAGVDAVTFTVDDNYFSLVKSFK